MCRRRLAAGTITVKNDSESLAPPVKKGANVMTLSKLERPKSKQTMKAMPSLKNARAALESASRSKKPEIKAFSG